MITIPNLKILKYILSLNNDLEQNNYKMYSIRLSTGRDDLNTPFSIWNFSIEDLDSVELLEN